MLGRYETAVPIGRGASGEVFKAWDPEAGRAVALKLFPVDPEGAHGENAARRQREAEAQRRLSHPSICEIYEVGETPTGRGFIAMRYVDGEPLDEVAARLPLRRRVELMLQVADAVGYAHDAGLIHRDLKPSNLLVEEQEDGSLRAFVLDFGIVRVAGETRLTETGQVLGTPGYLSPEQARGTTELEPSTDVFSLGVVLYQLLTGTVPFEAASGVGALLRVLEHDPPMANAVRPQVPPELAHIAAKAMEKDPRRRYRSAGALRRDLERFLESGTVSARGVGLVGRWVRQVERHPVAWGIGGLLLFLTLVSAGWSFRQQVVAERQTRDAERFTRQAAGLEAELRYLQMLPTRSIAAGRAEVQQGLERLEAEVGLAQGRARAAGEYAVGRAELALGRAAAALERFEQARQLGFDDPALFLDQGRARLAVAREELRQIDLLRDPAVRAAERQRLREAMRTEALPFLERAAQAPESSRGRGGAELANALVALLLDRWESARAGALQVTERLPWMFEADLIRADSYREESAAARFRDDHAAALAAIEAESAVLREAALRAPSAPALFERLCENGLARAMVEVADHRSDQGWQERWEAAFASGEADCATAREVLPESRQAARLSVEIGWRRALQRLRWRGAEEALAGLDSLEAAARAQVARHPAAFAESWNLGNVLYARARIERERGTPMSAILEEAAAELERSLRRAPGVAAGWLSLGHAWTQHGHESVVRGDDPLASYRRALAAYRQGLTGSRVQQSRLYSAICTVSGEVAYYGLEHRETVEEAEVAQALAEGRAACEAALERDPEYLSARSNLGLLLWTEVEWLESRGESPEEAGRAAVEEFRRLLERAPNHVSGRINFAGLMAGLGSWRLDAAGETLSAETLVEQRAALRESGEAIRSLLDRFPVDTSINLARVAILEAATVCRGIGSEAEIESEWARAREAVDGVERAGTSPKYLALVRTVLERRAAECSQRLGDEEAARIAARRGLAAAEQLLEIDPQLAEGLEERQRLRELAGAPAGRPAGP